MLGTRPGQFLHFGKTSSPSGCATYSVTLLLAQESVQCDERNALASIRQNRPRVERKRQVLMAIVSPSAIGRRL